MPVPTQENAKYQYNITNAYGWGEGNNVGERNNVAQLKKYSYNIHPGLVLDSLG